MSNVPLSSPAVVLFDQTAGQSFSSSSFAAAGRDHINFNIHLATAGASPPYPAALDGHSGQDYGPPPPLQVPLNQDVQPPQNSLLGRVYRRLRSRVRRRPRTIGTILAPQVTESVSLLPDPVSRQPVPATPPSSPTHDLIVLPNGSSISPFDSRSQLSLSRSHVTSDEEVYERSLLGKGQGYPLFDPQPFGNKPAKYGDFGILSQDGFQSFGNLYDTDDQRNFFLECPPEHSIACQSEKLSEGSVLATGIEEVARLAGPGSDATDGFTFHCRNPQGAVLALPSPGELETLTPKSRNHLRDYLCQHGTQLMSRLCQERYLNAGQSLYVVTGTIKSSSWGIAVHTSPMQEPYDQLVLSKRQAASGPTHEWTRRGGAYARCGSSAVVDEGGRRSKDQSLFLRGFLLTPSLDLERKVGANGSFSASDSSSSSGNSDSASPDRSSKRGDAASRRQQGTPSRDCSHSLGHERSSQLQDHFNMSCSVEQFPASLPYSKGYYPSQHVNDTLLQNKDIDVAITHDDDWRHMVAKNYLDDETLHTLMANFWNTNTSTVYHRVATTLPLSTPTNCSFQHDSLPYTGLSSPVWDAEELRALSVPDRSSTFAFLRTPMLMGWKPYRTVAVSKCRSYLIGHPSISEFYPASSINQSIPHFEAAMSNSVHIPLTSSLAISQPFNKAQWAPIPTLTPYSSVGEQQVAMPDQGLDGRRKHRLKAAWSINDGPKTRRFILLQNGDTPLQSNDQQVSVIQDAPKIYQSEVKKPAAAAKAKGAVRAKRGCYTCRIRRKNCNEDRTDEETCKTCTRLSLKCLDFGSKRPEWLRENHNVVMLRAKIKTFLASQGLYKDQGGTTLKLSGHPLASGPSSGSKAQNLSLSDKDDLRYRLRTSPVRDQLEREPSCSNPSGQGATRPRQSHGLETPHSNSALDKITHPRYHHNSDAYRGSRKATDLSPFLDSITKGLEYLHYHTVPPEDIKSPSLLASNDICCLITDFGMSEVELLASSQPMGDHEHHLSSPFAVPKCDLQYLSSPPDGWAQNTVSLQCAPRQTLLSPSNAHSSLDPSTSHHAHSQPIWSRFHCNSESDNGHFPALKLPWRKLDEEWTPSTMSRIPVWNIGGLPGPLSSLAPLLPFGTNQTLSQVRAFSSSVPHVPSSTNDCALHDPETTPDLYQNRYITSRSSATTSGVRIKLEVENVSYS